MPKKLPMALTLYPKDPTVSTVQQLIPFGQIDRFVHSTRLPGGFHELSFVIAVTQDEFWAWREERLPFRLQLAEDVGKLIWEGRLERVELENLWAIRLVFRGYWRNFTDGVPDTTFIPNTTGDSIIQTLRDSHIPTLQLGTSDAEFDSPGVTIDQEYNSKGEGWDCWRILTDPTRGVLSYGNTSDQKMDLAVWEDREIHYKARNPSVITWEAYVADIRGGVRHLPVDVDLDRMYNNVLTVYESADSVTRTAYAANSDSQAKFLTRDLHIPNIGESASATATGRRDTELARTKELSQQTPGFTVTRIQDVNGVEWPLCRVRAGEVIRIPDFVPKTADLDSVTLDAFSTFFIEETECDHAEGQLTIRPDRDAHDIATILARNGIR